MLGTKIILQFFLDNSINLLSFVTTIILARVFGADTLGLVSFVLAVLSVIAFIGDLGLTQAHIKKVSEGYNLGYASGSYFLLKGILGLIILLLAFSYLFLGRYFGNFGLTQNQTFFILMLFGFLFSYFGQAVLYTFQARQEVFKYNLGLIIGRLAKLIVIVLTALFLFSLDFIALAYFLEGLMILFASVVLFSSYPLKLPRLKDLKVYINFAIPFLVWIPLANFAGNIDRLLLKNFWNLSEVGLFFAIQSLVFLPQSFSTAAMNLFFPQISKLSKRGEKDEIQKSANLVVKYLAIIVIPIVVLTLVFSEQIIFLILGREFLRAKVVLEIFAVAVLILTISRPYSYVLLGSEKHRLVPFINSFVLILVFILELVLIPRSILGINLFGLGASGAALANLLSWSTGLLIFVFATYKFLRVNFYFPLLKQLFAGALMYIFLKFLTGSLSFYQPISAVTIAIFSVLIFVGIIYVLGELTLADISYLKTIVRPKAFISSIRNEWEEKAL